MCLAIERLPFRKGYLPTWTEEIFKIHNIVKPATAKGPTTYKVSDQEGEHINGTFYESELQKVTEPASYRIEKVIRKKKSKDGKTYVLVKWSGYPEKFNSYVLAEDLLTIDGKAKP